MLESMVSLQRRTNTPAIAIAAFLLGSAAQAQQAEDGADAARGEVIEVQRATGPIEEVIVTGQRTFQSLVNEAARETESFYMRLNEVLDDDDFRITCDSERPAGTNIRYRVCRTRYQQELLSRQALSIMQGSGTDDDGNLTFTGTVYDTHPDLAIKHQAFEEAMLEAVNVDPELNASVWRLLQLKAAVENYETPRQQRRRLEQEAEGRDDD